MEGRQKLFYLPEPHTDFIFANICEELGLIGALCVLSAFCILGYRGLRTAYMSDGPVCAIFGVWLTVMILVQSFFNMSVVIALLPDEGDSAAVHFVGRNGGVYYAGLYGRAAECDSRD